MFTIISAMLKEAYIDDFLIFVINDISINPYIVVEKEALNMQSFKLHNKGLTTFSGFSNHMTLNRIKLVIKTACMKFMKI